jgi:hypothetical protein
LLRYTTRGNAVNITVSSFTWSRRDAFHRGLAEYIAEFKKQQRVKAEQMRQDAWREFKKGIFTQALKAPMPSQLP